MKLLTRRRAGVLTGMALALLAGAAAAATNAAPSAAAPVPATNAAPAATLVLSLERCLDMALGGNMAIRLGRLEPLRRAEDFVIAGEPFTPTLFATGEYADEESPTANSQVGAEVLAAKNQSATAGLRKRWASGLRTDLAWAYGRRENNSSYSTLNPAHDNSLQVEFSQPLLRGFGSAVNRADLERAIADKTLADADLEILLDTELLNAYRAYWELVRAAALLDLERASYALATNQVAIVRGRLEVGSAARLELTSAEAALARQREAVITALRQYRKAGDALWFRIRPSGDPAAYAVTIVPSTEPEPTAAMRTVPDVNAAVAVALAERPELRLEEARVARADIDVAVARNAVGPDLDLTGRYGVAGVAGSAGASSRQVTDRDYPRWAVGASLEFLFDRESRKARWRQARYGKEAAELGRERALAQLVVEVRASVFDLEAAVESVAATARTLQLAREQYEGELERLRVGSSTVFQVDTLRRDLLAADRNRLNASIDVIVANAILDVARGRFAKSIVAPGGRSEE